ncbi:response regulator transcription factor [Amycolatopsis suaedae]|uniref:Response regulator transcription factor n=1 Tax=Amycolatopsis suaedae TaxID=2510978 RepID=A0A4Q7J272_9PSEU|nr:response regulator transcription factor [Amycolatopsis suaedae]RZQ61530.1 response regulator transcription factor [Amycolatopsis suaedae]
MTTKHRVLVVEDDVALRTGVAAALRAESLDVEPVGSLGAAGDALAGSTYDCVVFDRMLPDGDAIHFVHERRRSGWAVPVLFLTALDGVADRVSGFEHGGDDYLVKPFDTGELAARVQILCHRAAGGRPSVLRHDDLELDCARREVRRAGVLLTLSGREFAVLEYLATRTGQAVSRTDLIEHCWDAESDPMSNVADVVIKRLRRKLGQPQLIHTVHGVGYRLS